MNLLLWLIAQRLIEAIAIGVPYKNIDFTIAKFGSSNLMYFKILLCKSSKISINDIEIAIAIRIDAEPKL